MGTDDPKHKKREAPNRKLEPHPPPAEDPRPPSPDRGGPPAEPVRRYRWQEVPVETD